MDKFDTVSVCLEFLCLIVIDLSQHDNQVIISFIHSLFDSLVIYWLDLQPIGF